MKKALIGLSAMFGLLQPLSAQPSKVDQNASQVGVCMSALYLPGMAASPMMLIHMVSAANGDQELRKSIDAQATSSLGIDSKDLDFFLSRLIQEGKSLQDAVSNLPSLEVVSKFGLDTLSHCMTRKGVPLADTKTIRCIALGNLGFQIALFRLSGVEKIEVEAMISTQMLKESDEKFRDMAQGMVDRVFDINSRMSRLPENHRGAALLFVSQEEFARCVNASR